MPCMLSASLSVYIKALPLETCLIFLHSKALILMNVMVDFLHDMAGKSEHIPTAVCQLSIHVFPCSAIANGAFPC